MKKLMLLFLISFIIGCEKKKVEPSKESKRVKYIVNVYNESSHYLLYRVDNINNKITHQDKFGFYFETCNSQELMIGGRFKEGATVEMKILINDKVAKGDTVNIKPDSGYEYSIEKMKYKLNA